MELVVELLQELHPLLQPRLGKDQHGCPKVVGAGPLLEAAPGHQHDSGVLQHLHAIEDIGLTSRGLNRLLGELD